YFLVMQRRVFFGLLKPSCEHVREATELAAPAIMLAAITIAVGILMPLVRGTFLLPLKIF
ncbi:MAG: NADH-quinone oxidoreductase subunit L, partial [Kiritimatiellia bacterium]